MRDRQGCLSLIDNKTEIIQKILKKKHNEFNDLQK